MPSPTASSKVRLTGEREDIKAMITALDPVLDIITDWRIFPQRTGTRVSTYLEARPRTNDNNTQVDENGAQNGADTTQDGW
jgi:hypothetical protein